MSSRMKQGRASTGPRQRHMRPKTEAKTLKRKREQEDLQKLQDEIDSLDPRSEDITKFSTLPLSKPTADGLEASHFETLSDIQARAIPLALKGRDILGAAKTGSGKTLAFLVPLLEKLYRARWTEFDGLGAIVLTPTRELAVQAFQVLRKIGRFHNFSAGLVIGGKNVTEEADRISKMNILVCTPGRLLHHLDQTAGFDVDNLQILVLDEADRILDLGFLKTVDVSNLFLVPGFTGQRPALVEHLPKSRQTLLFSATQSKKVSDLARLSLKDPEYVAVHESAAAATPTTLTQYYIVTPLQEKLDTLYGFIKANLKSKMIVFLSSAKQVRFCFEVLKRMQPGIPLSHIIGQQKQMTRLQITNAFSRAKYACLLSTDVVARGMDFPSVDFVCQVDCPDDVDTYVHRVGRTARYDKSGKAVLFLDPSEELGMLKRLEQRKVPIQKVNIKDKKRQSIQEATQNLCFQNSELKYLGQKAFISYVRSIRLQKDKNIFDIERLDLEAYAASLGLPGAPLFKFQKGEDVKKLKNAPRAGWSSDSDSELDEDGKKRKGKGDVRTKYDKMFERTNQDVLTSHYSKLMDGEDDDANGEGADGDDFLTVKRVIRGDDLDKATVDEPALPAAKIISLGGNDQFVVDSKRREKMLKSKKTMLKFRGKGERIVFDDEGVAHDPYAIKDEDDFRREGSAEAQRQRFVDDEAARVKEADVEDKQLAKDKRREKREKRKAREAMEDGELGAHGAVARLPPTDDGEDPLALLASLPMAGEGSESEAEHMEGEEEEEEEDEEDRRPRKRAKKWFEDDSEDEGRRNKKKQRKGSAKYFEITEQPDTLEDQEALAAGLLDA